MDDFTLTADDALLDQDELSKYFRDTAYRRPFLRDTNDLDDYLAKVHRIRTAAMAAGWPRPPVIVKVADARRWIPPWEATPREIRNHHQWFEAWHAQMLATLERGERPS